MFKIIIPLLVFLILFTFVFAFYGYPLFTDDAVCFLPASYFINHYDKLINPFYISNLNFDNNRLLFYPPLFPFVTSLIVKILPTNTNVIHIALTLLDDLTIVIASASIYFYVRKENLYSSWQTCLFIIVWLFAFFGFQGVGGGRPEILSKLFLSCFLLNNVLSKGNVRSLLNGIILGLNAITSPISTFYLMIIYACCILYKKDFKLVDLIYSSVGLLLVFLGFVSLYPYKISELIANMTFHSRIVIFNRSSDGVQSFISGHLLSVLPFSILPFLIVLIYVLYRLVVEKKYLVLCLVVALSITVSYFSFRAMAMSYNLYVLTPIILFVLFVVYMRAYEYSLISNSRLAKFVPFFIIFTLAVNSIGIARQIAVFSVAQRQYYSADLCRTNIINVIKHVGKGKKIAISASLWPLCLNVANKVVMLDAHKKTTLNPSIQYLIIQQNYTGKSRPVNYEHYRLIKNQFNLHKIQVMGATVARTCPGYQVAIYERQ
jgi:hypothetical protein